MPPRPTPPGTALAGPSPASPRPEIEAKITRGCGHCTPRVHPLPPHFAPPCLSRPAAGLRAVRTAGCHFRPAITVRLLVTGDTPRPPPPIQSNPSCPGPRVTGSTYFQDTSKEVVRVVNVFHVYRSLIFFMPIISKADFSIFQTYLGSRLPSPGIEAARCRCSYICSRHEEEAAWRCSRQCTRPWHHRLHSTGIRNLSAAAGSQPGFGLGEKSRTKILSAVSNSKPDPRIANRRALVDSGQSVCTALWLFIYRELASCANSAPTL